MPADNPASWFILMCIGLYFIARFLHKIMMKELRLKAERERASNEFFKETALDKRNIVSYNNHIRERGYYELHDDRH